MSLIHLITFRRNTFAAFHTFRTTRMKFTACRRFMGGRNASGGEEYGLLALPGPVSALPKEAPGGIRMHRVTVKFYLYLRPPQNFPGT